MPTSDWEALLNYGAPFQNQSGSAQSNFTAATVLEPASFTLPGFSLQVGSVLRLTARGIFSTSGTPTLTLTFYYGGTGGVALITTGAVTTASGAANAVWEFKADMRVQTIGSSGTCLTLGTVAGITAATGFSVVPTTSSTGNQATIDTTSNKAIDIAAAWGTGSASNSITCHQFLVESVV